MALGTPKGWAGVTDGERVRLNFRDGQYRRGHDQGDAAGVGAHARSVDRTRIAAGQLVNAQTYYRQVRQLQRCDRWRTEVRWR